MLCKWARTTNGSTDSDQTEWSVETPSRNQQHRDMVTSSDLIMEVWVTERAYDISTHDRSATEHKVRVQQKVSDLWVCESVNKRVERSDQWMRVSVRMSACMREKMQRIEPDLGQDV